MIKKTPANGDGFQCSSSSTSSDDNDDYASSQEALRASVYASECIRMCLRTSKITKFLHASGYLD